MDENPYKATVETRPPNFPTCQGLGTDWFALGGLALGAIMATTVGLTLGWSKVVGMNGDDLSRGMLASSLIVGTFTLAGWLAGRWWRP